jgi:ribulose-phosphate 3-epimerase
VFQVKDRGCQVGVAINPGTPVSAVQEVLPFLDIVLVMTVNPGFGGQAFIPRTLGKVRELRRVVLEEGYSARIEGDGGVKADRTALESVRAGATILVAGTAIFNQEETIPRAMEQMRACIRGVTTS